MDIIIISSRFASARTFRWKAHHTISTGAVLLFVILSLAAVFSYLSIRFADQLPWVTPLIQQQLEHYQEQNQTHLNENLNHLARRVGEIQAQMVRIDAIGQRVAGMAGVSQADLKLRSTAGRGGPLHGDVRSLTQDELNKEILQLESRLEEGGDQIYMLEQFLLDRQTGRVRLPTVSPVKVEMNSSSYGWRIDPLTGMRAMHEGADFSAPIGTPVHAAAAGVVGKAEYHPEYGNLIEIDHGNGYVTRYAHNSANLVTPGTRVKQGQKIAEVGSTGRSTGSHLHFEIRLNGQPQNPQHFLAGQAPIASR